MKSEFSLLLPPLPHQREGIEFLMKTPYAILGDEMGLGKTYQALAVTAGKAALIICPAFLIRNWKEEIEKYVTASDRQYTIVSYEGFTKMWFKQEHIPYVFNLIIDEAHYIKTPSAKRAKSIAEYVSHTTPNRAILLTGTPIKNRVQEIFTLLSLCKALPPKLDNYWWFCHHFTNVTTMNIHGRKITQFEGHKNLEELKTLLNKCYLRRRAIDVLDLPDLIRINHKVDKEHHDPELERCYDDYCINGIMGLIIITT